MKIKKVCVLGVLACLGTHVGAAQNFNKQNGPLIAPTQFEESSPYSEQPSEKISELGKYSGYSAGDYGDAERTTVYIPMPDGVRLATDVYLPRKRKPNEKLPTILYQTRYVRSLEPKAFIKPLKSYVTTNISIHEIKYFVKHGYAVVTVDTRGSGASYGVRKMEFSPEEIKDGASVCDWITQQDWSSGKIGSTGISYVGTTALLLAVNKHPAVKAIAPRSAIFDLYADITAPGGINQIGFIDIWAKTTRALDFNEFTIFGKRAQRLVRGAHPVKVPHKRKVYAEARENRPKNFDLANEVRALSHRDAPTSSGALTIDHCSAHLYLKDIKASGTPLYFITGWYDGAMPNSALNAYRNLSNQSRVLMGNWDHGPHDELSPFIQSKLCGFDVKAELLRFFDYHLKDIPNNFDKQAPVYYYETGAERWQTTQSWPPKQSAAKHYYLQPNHQLTLIPETATSHTVYQIDTTASTGGSSRWNSLTPLYRNGLTAYPDRAVADEKLVIFESEVLNKPLSIAGYPQVELHIAADTTDANVFVYLEEVDSSGRVGYITEGMLRALHRKIGTNPPYTPPGVYHSYLKQDAMPLKPHQPELLSFEMIPTAHQFKKGSKIRISVAGADTPHFLHSNPLPTTLKIYHGGTHLSKVSLPVIH